MKDITIEKVLSAVKEAESLAQLRYDLGIAESEVLKFNKYFDSEYNGEHITGIRFFENGTFFLITKSGEYEFKIEEDQFEFFDFGCGYSGDFALCEIANEPGVELQK